MSKLLCLLIFGLLLSVVLLSGNAYAAGNTNVSILFLNTKDMSKTSIGEPVQYLPEVFLSPAGYTNVKTVITIADFRAEWAKRDQYNVLIIAYHNFLNDADLVQWFTEESANLKAWVSGGGILITTAGRDEQEIDLAKLFELSPNRSASGTAEAIVMVAPAFADGIADGKMDSSTSTDATPYNGEFYDEPLPVWARIVTLSSAGKVSSVAGQYQKGGLWLGAGFENTNLGAGLDAAQSFFPGVVQLWKNVMDYLTSIGASPVNPAGKSAFTWGEIKTSL